MFEKLNYYIESGEQFITMNESDFSLKLDYNLFTDLLVLDEWITGKRMNNDYLI